MFAWSFHGHVYQSAQVREVEEKAPRFAVISLPGPDLAQLTSCLQRLPAGRLASAYCETPRCPKPIG